VTTVQDRLAERLAREAAVIEIGHDSFAYYESLAAALMSVVEEMRREAAAEALEEMADGIPRSDSETEAKRMLRDRATELRSS
jgi:hypothetical protein